MGIHYSSTYSFACIILYLTLCTTIIKAQGVNQISVTLDDLEMEIESSRELAMSISDSGSELIFSYQFSLVFDTTLLVIESINIRNSLSEGGLFISNADTNGVLQIAYAANNPIQEDGPLLFLQVRSKQQAGAATLDIKDFIINEGAYLPNLRDGNIRILDDLFSGGPSSDSVYISFQVPDVKTNSDFEVIVDISRVEGGFQAIDFVLSYDPSFLMAKGISLNETLLQDATPLIFDAASALINVTVDEPGFVYGAAATISRIIGEGDLLRIQFESLEKAGASEITFDSFQFDEGNLNASIKKDTVFIQSSVLPGDVSLDDRVTVFDAQLVIEHMTGEQTLTGDALNAAEVSGNGLVTSFDASLILQYALEIINCFPVEPGCESSKKGYEHDGVLAWNQPQIEHDGNVLFPLQLQGTSHSITALDVEFPLDSLKLDQFQVKPNLPEDWHWHASQVNGKVIISMAGISPLPEGHSIDLSFDSEVNQKQILEGHFSVNETMKLPLAASDILKGSGEIILNANYPNPFQHTTTLNFTLPAPEWTRLEVFDILGRRLITLIDNQFDAGNHSLTFDGRDLSAGMYFIRLETESTTLSRHMIKR